MEAGFFKGNVSVYDKVEKQKQQQEITEIFNQIQQIMRAYHQVGIGSDLKMELQSVLCKSEKIGLQMIMRDLGIEKYAEKAIEFIHQYNFEQMMQNQMNFECNCQVNLYLLEGIDLASRDLGSHSDPYYIVSLGKDMRNNKESYQLDEPNPKFYDVLTFSTTFPGSDPLIIEIWDYDDLFGDDLIG